MLSINEFNTIINLHQPNPEKIAIISNSNINVRAEYLHLRDLPTGRKYNVIYTDVLWNIVWDKDWITILSESLEENGIIITSMLYAQTHLIAYMDEYNNQQIINKYDFPISGSDLSLWIKRDWMVTFAEHWTCIYDSGMHQAWKLGKSEWKIPNDEVSVITTQYDEIPGKSLVRVITPCSHKVYYDWNHDIIKEIGGLVPEDDLWYSTVRLVVSAYYNRLLGGSKLQLRDSKRNLVIPGMISVPNGKAFRNVSDPYI